MQGAGFRLEECRSGGFGFEGWLRVCDLLDGCKAMGRGLCAKISLTWFRMVQS